MYIVISFFLIIFTKFKIVNSLKFIFFIICANFKMFDSFTSLYFIFSSFKIFKTLAISFL